MELHIIILFILYTSILINVLIIKTFFEKLTKYNGIEFYNMPLNFRLLFLFFGYIMIFFYKRIKEYKKKEYMKNYIKQIDFFRSIQDTINSDYSMIYDEKYITYKRYLKMKKLKIK